MLANTIKFRRDWHTFCLLAPDEVRRSRVQWMLSFDLILELKCWSWRSCQEFCCREAFCWVVRPILHLVCRSTRCIEVFEFLLEAVDKVVVGLLDIVVDNYNVEQPRLPCCLDLSRRIRYASLDYSL